MEEFEITEIVTVLGGYRVHLVKPGYMIAHPYSYPSPSPLLGVEYAGEDEGPLYMIEVPGGWTWNGKSCAWAEPDKCEVVTRPCLTR